jgi:hypothetical protein
MGWLDLNSELWKTDCFQIAPLLAVAEDLSQSRTSMISQSFQINLVALSFFKECRISVLPVPVYPPRILRLKDCSKNRTT